MNRLKPDKERKCIKSVCYAQRNQAQAMKKKCGIAKGVIVQTLCSTERSICHKHPDFVASSTTLIRSSFVDLQTRNKVHHVANPEQFIWECHWWLWIGPRRRFFPPDRSSADRGTGKVMNNCLANIRWAAAALLLLLTLVSSVEHDSLLQEGNDYHVVIKLKKRDDALAKKIAEEHHMVVRGAPFMDSYYHLEHSDVSVSRRQKRAVTGSLSAHPDVSEHFVSPVKKRLKRDYIFPDLQPSPHPEPTRRNRQAPNLPIPKLPFPDPLYNDQWYLLGGAVGGFDMNVHEAWLLGYAGRNVSISILDDGIQRDHPDLAENYDALASTDINDNDDDPTPLDNDDNKHGTRCAGEVGAVAGNNQCGVGVAFKCKIGGVRMLDGPISDSVEARSLAFNQQHIDIYSASWGPNDNGQEFDGPGPLVKEAFFRGIKQGRGGRGNIFVWASGNGGSVQDSCSADGYQTSIYTLSISSVTFDNHRPWYLEECPSTIASAYSSGGTNQPAVVTVDVPHGCTKTHTGTSASAPLAAGIIALALEANPSLTWRDVQHLVVRTANPIPLLNNPGWSINSVGRRVSHKFGYGLMDGGKLVKLARVWETVPEQHLCTYETKNSHRPLTGRFSVNFTLEVNGCNGQNPVLYLEHVQVLSTIVYGNRGDLRLSLISPKGTQSLLLSQRPYDHSSRGFDKKWPFLSVHMWGEDPRGTWTLTVESVTSNHSVGGTFYGWTLLLYGTETPAQSTDPKYEPFKAETSFLSKVLDELTSQVSLPFHVILDTISAATLFAGLQLVTVLVVLLTTFALLMRMRICCCSGSQMPAETRIFPVTALGSDSATLTVQRPKSKKKSGSAFDTAEESV
uniref:P/Homo B domain-containing protein n=1 Tax=Steinernema glaseri TaxID=37863 RepID=A0A1I7Y3L2_9BILA